MPVVSSHPRRSLSIAAVLLAAFALWELHTDEPMLPVRIFRNLRFTAASVSITAAFFALFGFIFLVTQYFQLVRDYKPLDAGVRTVPVAAAIAVASVLAPKVVHAMGSKRTVALGLVQHGAKAPQGVAVGRELVVDHDAGHVLLLVAAHHLLHRLGEDLPVRVQVLGHAARVEPHMGIVLADVSLAARAGAGERIGDRKDVHRPEQVDAGRAVTQRTDRLLDLGLEVAADVHDEVGVLGRTGRLEAVREQRRGDLVGVDGVLGATERLDEEPLGHAPHPSDAPPGAGTV